MPATAKDQLTKLRVAPSGMPVKYSNTPMSDSTAGIGPMAIAVLPDMRERLFWVADAQTCEQALDARARDEGIGRRAHSVQELVRCGEMPMLGDRRSTAATSGGGDL